MTDLLQQKQEWRTRMKALRNDLSNVQEIEAATAAAAHAQDLLKRCGSRIVGAYYPVRGELDTLQLMEMLVAADSETALPVVIEQDKTLEFHHWQPGMCLQEGPFGIPFPTDESLRLVPEALIIPLLGFDAQGARLGYGGGYYDCTLARLRADGKICAIGYAYDFQRIDGLPVESHDERLDWVVTPSGIYHCDR
jgi:5-formyltetrahydrofolate cyclo-ligase